MFSKIKKNYFIIILTALFLYFFFNLFDGDRGLMNFIKGGNSVDVNTDEGVLWAPWNDWWQYKWEGRVARDG